VPEKTTNFFSPFFPISDVSYRTVGWGNGFSKGKLNSPIDTPGTSVVSPFGRLTCTLNCCF
jgi:hypothetical protein